MIRRQAHGRERPSLRWVAAGLVVALVAALGGWLVADRIAADPATVAVGLEGAAAPGPARLKVSTDWAEVRSPPVLPGLAGAPAWTPYSGLADDRLGRARAAPTMPRSSRASSSSRPTAGCRGPRRRASSGSRRARTAACAAGESVLDVYAIPTTRGVLTLVCSARSGAAEAPTWCLTGSTQITVSGAQPLKPEPTRRTGCARRRP